MTSPTFNPVDDMMVTEVSLTYEAIIHSLYFARNRTNDPEAKRLYLVAITEAQGAQMWATKALTWTWGD